jgi:ATP-dependent protease ClpP protease subunit
MSLFKKSCKKRKRDKNVNKIKEIRKLKLKEKKHKCDIESDSDDEEYTLSSIITGDDNIDVKGNHIWFNTSVTKKSTNKLVKIIHDKNVEFIENKNDLEEIGILEPNPIYLHINSYGGDLLAVMAVIDAIQNSKIPVHTIVEGCAASAGTLMSVVGHHRTITKNSFMLIHQLSSGMYGKMEELEDEMINNKVFMNRIYDIYEDNTTMKRSEIQKALKKDLWWDAQTCLEKGLIDEII